MVGRNFFTLLYQCQLLLFVCFASTIEFIVLYSICQCIRVSVIANNVNWGVSGSDGETGLNDLIDSVNKNISSIITSNPSGDSIPPGAIPAINEGEQMLKEKCLKISNSNESYNTILVSQNHVVF